MAFHKNTDSFNADVLRAMAEAKPQPTTNRISDEQLADIERALETNLIRKPRN